MRNARTDCGDALKLALLAVPALVAMLVGQTDTARGDTAILTGVVVGLGLGLVALATRQLTIRPFGQ